MIVEVQKFNKAYVDIQGLLVKQIREERQKIDGQSAVPRTKYPTDYCSSWHFIVATDWKEPLRFWLHLEQ